MFEKISNEDSYRKFFHWPLLADEIESFCIWCILMFTFYWLSAESDSHFVYDVNALSFKYHFSFELCLRRFQMRILTESFFLLSFIGSWKLVILYMMRMNFYIWIITYLNMYFDKKNPKTVIDIAFYDFMSFFHFPYITFLFKMLRNFKNLVISTDHFSSNPYQLATSLVCGV